jgi:hypothetical protein
MNIIVTPGDFIKHKRASFKYFNEAQCILIVFDMSDHIDEDLIVQWTAMILKEIERHHHFF